MISDVYKRQEQVRLPKASSVALAGEKEKSVQGEAVFTLRPYYVRKSEAEELWEQRHPQTGAGR